MSNAVEYLTLDDLIELTILLMGEPPPIRDLGLLGSAAARPQTSAFGVDAYPDLWTKAGALLQSIVKNHALIDGNKRLGWLATAVFLEINGTTVTDVSNDAVFDLIMDTASSDRTPDALAHKLRATVQG
ncbi:MAG: Fic family protein [Acidimicrobiales bacterium]